MLPSQEVEIREYVDRSGKSIVAEWFAALDTTTQLRVASSLARIRAGNLAQVKSVGAGVQELRLDFGPGYRVYLGRVGAALVILLAGGSKRRQEADIARAQFLWREYKARKGGR